jgi:DNA-binding response OmpR family regulator
MKRIAWIEDDSNDISALVEPLEMAGYEVLRFRTVSEVDKDIEKICKCDAVILDILLPPKSENPFQGIAVLRKLREEKNYQKPVVVCTVVKTDGVIETLKLIGVSEIIHKPVRPSKLRDTVINFIHEDL